MTDPLWNGDCSSTAAETTPSSRALARSSLSAAGKKRVDSITKPINESRCLVTNFEPDGTIQYAHILPRAFGKVTQLEYHWGIKYGCLNVDTRLNVIRLRSDIHQHFDRGSILFLPSEKIVGRYLLDPQAAIEETTYHYTLVALRNVQTVPLTRRNIPPQPTSLQNYEYPFESFPVLESHAHPRFMIMHVGIALQKTTDFFDLTERYPSQEKLIRDIWKLFEKWTGIISKESLDKFKDSQPPQSDQESDSSTHTRPQRAVHKYNSTKRKAPATQPASPTPSSKRTRGVADSGQLNSETVSPPTFGDQLSTNLYQSKQALVHEWLSGITASDNEF
ncbi:hypothetical protein CPB83DRAFT_162875 [Crepidotus variabilis]|uniref:HNH nuclease domain-containing protein n=1 Tax=Crepidotus variabilis TaxID=179855 RepID=A0A9P6E3N5_9AGAR|nr:hypothetical protein CPB83DRAFT_162875 [Crepidotus variabilis]